MTTKLHRVTTSGTISELYSDIDGNTYSVGWASGSVPSLNASFEMPAPELQGDLIEVQIIWAEPIAASFGLSCDSAMSAAYALMSPAMESGFSVIGDGVDLEIVLEAVTFDVSFSLTTDDVTTGHVLASNPFPASFEMLADDLEYSGDVTLFPDPFESSFAFNCNLIFGHIPVVLEIYANIEAPTFDASFGIIPDGMSLISGSYSCVLTGSVDGENDITLPMSSFQARLRDGTPSYLSVVVPNVPKWISYVTARPNGDIIVYQGINELARASYDSMSYNQGGKNSSIQITGYRTTSATSPKTVALTGASVVSLQATGVRRVTAKIDWNVNPGDTVTWSGGSFVVDMVALAVATKSGTMTVTEVDV